MKKFSFSLDNVLNYKQQVLDNLRNEHAAILAQIRDQKNLIKSIQSQYVTCGEKLREEQQRGITVKEIYTYENYLEVLAYRVRKEQEVLALMNKQEETKRQEVIEARKESTSIEKLKEKKIDRYNKALQKEEELLIEEFVSHVRSRQTAG